MAKRCRVDGRDVEGVKGGVQWMKTGGVVV